MVRHTPLGPGHGGMTLGRCADFCVGDGLDAFPAPGWCDLTTPAVIRAGPRRQGRRGNATRRPRDLDAGFGRGRLGQGRQAGHEIHGRMAAPIERYLGARYSGAGSRPIPVATRKSSTSIGIAGTNTVGDYLNSQLLPDLRIR